MHPQKAAGIFGRELDRFVQIASLDQDESAQLFIGFGERSLGKSDLTVLGSQGGGGLHRLQRLSGNQMAAFSKDIVVRQGSWLRVPPTRFWIPRSDSSH
jgi:hypothetical protein